MVSNRSYLLSENSYLEGKTQCSLRVTREVLSCIPSILKAHQREIYFMDTKTDERMKYLARESTCLVGVCWEGWETRSRAYFHEGEL